MRRVPGLGGTIVAWTLAVVVADHRCPPTIRPDDKRHGSLLRLHIRGRVRCASGFGCK